MTKVVNFVLVILMTLLPVIQAGMSFPASRAATGAADTGQRQVETLPALAVYLHPDGQLHVGDQVSVDAFLSGPNIEGAANQDLLFRQPTQRGLRARVVYPVQKDLGNANFGVSDERSLRATLGWAWDTRGLAPGVYVLEFTVVPDEITWQKSVNLYPARAVEPTWKTVKTGCCEIHVISGTRAERDLPTLIPMIDAQAADVARRMHTTLQQPMVINLIPRVVGHGGFTTDEVTVSYPDINYPDIDVQIVLHHEMVHRVDGTLGGDLRPTLLVEGLAVYLSGGHFKPEPVIERAAALVNLGWFIPLQELTDNFYPSQHETGYIEAGALVGYLVERFGWDRYNQFYRDIHPTDDKKDSTVLEVALKKHLGMTLADLDRDFRTYLAGQPVGETTRQDLEMTVRYYDTVRAYQQRLDPTAYFRTVWLPAPKDLRQKGLVGDYLSSPEEPQNIAVMEMLQQAGEDLRAGNYERAGQMLDQVDDLLPRLPQAGELIPLEPELPTYIKNLSPWLIGERFLWGD